MPNHQLSHLPIPLFPNKASCNLGWLQIYVAEEGLELLLSSTGITGIRFQALSSAGGEKPGLHARQPGNGPDELTALVPGSQNLSLRRSPYRHFSSNIKY